MAALRKFSVQQPLLPIVRPERDGPRLAGDQAATHSPALALRDHLASRLEELLPATEGDAMAVASPKLPMMVRVMVIVGLSLALWTSLILATLAVL